MKKKSLLTGLTVAAACFPLLTSCVTRTVYVQSPPPGPPGPVVVDQAPPPPQTEVIVTSPGPAYVWVGGFWSWQGRWVWMPGRWSLPPYGHARWVGGHWHRHGHGYVWVAGGWR